MIEVIWCKQIYGENNNVELIWYCGSGSNTCSSSRRRSISSGGVGDSSSNSSSINSNSRSKFQIPQNITIEQEK